MADPVVHITNGIPDLGTGNITTLGLTIQPQSSTTSGVQGPLVQGAVTTAAPTYTTGQTNPLSLDTSGNLRTSVLNTVAVTGAFFQATQPVSGTVAVSSVGGTVACTQSGTWNINNIVGSITLPTGAATAAKQPALGTAGAPSIDVITVQGIASMTPLKVDNSGVTQPISGNVGITGNVNCVQVTSPWVTSVTGNVTCVQSGNWTSRCVGNAGGIFDFSSAQNVASPGQAILIGGQFNTVPTTITSTNSSPLQLDTNANLLVNVKAGSVGRTWNLSTASDTVNVQQPLASVLNATVVGDTASGATDGGNPVKVGGLAKTTNPTAVTDGQRVNALFDKLGKQIAVGAIRVLKGVQKTSITTASETTVVTAGGAGVFNDVYAIVVTNKSATSVFVDFKDATAGTTRMTLAAPANDTRGFTVPVDSAMIQAAAANNWTATVSTGVTSIEISMLYVSNT